MWSTICEVVLWVSKDVVSSIKNAAWREAAKVLLQAGIELAFFLFDARKRRQFVVRGKVGHPGRNCLKADRAGVLYRCVPGDVMGSGALTGAGQYCDQELGDDRR